MGSKPTVKLEELLKHERQYKKLKKQHNVGFNNAKHGYPARGGEQFSIPRLDSVLNTNRNISPVISTWHEGNGPKRRNSQMQGTNRLRLQNIHERSGHSMIDDRHSGQDNITISEPMSNG